MFRLRHGMVQRVVFDAQMPLGMFEDSETWSVAACTGRPRTTTAPLSVSGALRETIAAAGRSRPYDAARAVVDGLTQHHSGELPADAAVVCLDRWGRQRHPEG
ncbi:hypothetical protein GCM10010274_59980 [Streptomyces lavendofoliae]|uniref:Uncharacterized protein n=1 Tax=Streptomyces lavendofoliae TaxID=67314 RepID=A0A918I533_9ACTN|nr:hypothetical protein GCM10010274_59980 [Streptomyces lavendofoliae]